MNDIFGYDVDFTTDSGSEIQTLRHATPLPVAVGAIIFYGTQLVLS
jgi:hypothetical protein